MDTRKLIFKCNDDLCFVEMCRIEQELQLGQALRDNNRTRIARALEAIRRLIHETELGLERLRTLEEAQTDERFTQHKMYQHFLDPDALIQKELAGVNYEIESQHRMISYYRSQLQTEDRYSDYFRAEMKSAMARLDTLARRTEELSLRADAMHFYKADKFQLVHSLFTQPPHEEQPSSSAHTTRAPAPNLYH